MPCKLADAWMSWSHSCLWRTGAFFCHERIMLRRKDLFDDCVSKDDLEKCSKADFSRVGGWSHSHPLSLINFLAGRCAVVRRLQDSCLFVTESHEGH